MGFPSPRRAIVAAAVSGLAGLVLSLSGAPFTVPRSTGATAAPEVSATASDVSVRSDREYGLYADREYGDREYGGLSGDREYGLYADREYADREYGGLG